MSLLTHCGAQFRLHQRQLRKTAVGRSKWKDGLSFDTRLAPGLWPVHGAGTNLIVGALVQREALKKIFWSCPSTFWPKSTISCFGERFREGQYSLASFLFAVLLLTVPSVPYRVGATVCGYALRGSDKSLTPVYLSAPLTAYLLA